LPIPLNADQLAVNAQYTAILARDPIATPYLLLLDAGGNFRWGRSFPELRASNPGRGTTLHLTTDGIHLIATRDPGVASIALVRLTLDGETVGSCLVGEAFTVEVTPLENPFQSDLDPTAGEAPVAPGSPFGAEPSFLELADFSCPIECPEDDCPGCTDCGDPFLFAYDGGAGSFAAVQATASAYYLGGSSNDEAIVVATDREGALLWQRRIRPAGERSLVSELHLDDEGFLYGYGRYAINGSSQLYSFIFRIDPATGDLAWAHTFTTQNESVGLYDMLAAPGGQYELIGATNLNPTPGTCDAFFYTIERATGQLLAVRREYHGVGCEAFSQGKRLPGGDLILSGRLAIGGTGENRFRPTLTRLTPDGTELWSRYYLRPSSVAARLYAYTLAPTETDRHSLLLTGDANGGQATSENLWLVQTDLDGNVQSTVEYTFPETVLGTSLQATDYGYLAMGNTGSSATFLLALDPNGAILWAKRYSGIQQVTGAINNPVAIIPEGIVLGGRLAGTNEPAFVRLTSDGTPPATCAGEEALAVTATPLADIFTDDHSLNAYETNNALEGSPEYLPGNLSLSELSCPLDCPEDGEICDDGIDNNGDGLVDCEDPDLALDCCCTEVPPLDLGPDTTLCAIAPLTVAADTGFVSYQWQDGVTTRLRVIDTPGTYRLIATDSCGRTATDSLRVRELTTPVLDLGPDTTVCSESVVQLDAGPGFASYRWVDGSTEPTYTTWGEGTFWVEATDSCGTVQRDTVTVTFDPATVIDLGKVREACPGDTLRLRVDGFTEHTWYPETGFDCRTCPEVTYTVGSDTMVWIVAQTATGCLSTDSLRIVSTPGVGSFSTAEICAGDTLAFGDTLLTTAGEYIQPVAIGCFAQDTLQLSVLPTASSSSAQTICAGDSLLIGGQYRTTSGTYVDTLAAANGCDSLHTIELTVAPSPIITDEVLLCPGDSVFVFDQYVTSAGIYERIFTTAAGCDSTVSIRVTVSDLDLAAQVVQGACREGGEGVALATATGGTGPYSFAWSDGRTTRQVDRLAPGDYTVTVTDAVGCRQTGSLTIDTEGVILPVWEVSPESCPGAEDGRLRLLDPIQGYTYTLADRSNTTFSGLAPGNYLLRIDGLAGCTDTVTVNIPAAAPLLVALPADTTIRLGDSLLIVPAHNAGPDIRFAWDPPAVVDCDSCRTAVVTPPASVLLRLTLRDSNGCTATDEQFIRVDRREALYLPTALSPNGDGTNDTWRPYPGPSVRRITLVQIFDRWGNLVYEARDLDLVDPNAGWDGTFGGQPLNPAVFVYRVQAELTSEEQEDWYGEVMLIR
jgi:gliding motility-associated-like protein